MYLSQLQFKLQTASMRNIWQVTTSMHAAVDRSIVKINEQKKLFEFIFNFFSMFGFKKKNPLIYLHITAGINNNQSIAVLEQIPDIF